MVKRIAVWVMAVMFFAGTMPVFAAEEGKKGPTPSKKAYEHASERARFKRTEDLKDKEDIKAAKKAEKEAEKAKRETEKAKRAAEKEARKMKKGFGGFGK